MSTTRHSPAEAFGQRLACLKSKVSDPISRREAICRGLAGAAGLTMANRLAPRLLTATETSHSTTLKAKAKSVIQLWMGGGPSHLDTFDPKPAAGHDYCGPLDHPIPTNVDGIMIGQLLPELAKQADKYSIIRSMTHAYNDHPIGTYMTQTGRKPGDRLVYPGAGAVVSFFKGYDAGYQGLIPPYVVLTSTSGGFREEGFLGPRYKPFITGGDPAKSPFMVEGVVAEGISNQQQHERRHLLQNLDTLGKSLKNKAALTAFYESRDQAYDMILGDGAKVFDLSQEKEELRLRYGHSPYGDGKGMFTFGQACLVARRLVERGVPYITVNYWGWDTHNDHFSVFRDKLASPMDQGMAGLLKDLSDRGLLESTIVWWSGEFGRTPRIQWPAPFNGGRSHWSKCFSAVVAGGGFKGGQIVGASDAKGEEVKQRPVYPGDLLGSIYELMGIDPDGKLPHPQGLDLTVTPTAAEGIPVAGRLKEIM